MEHVDALEIHIEQLIVAAKTRQELGLAEYRSGVDAERVAKHMRDELMRLERGYRRDQDADMPMKMDAREVSR